MSSTEQAPRGLQGEQGAPGKNASPFSRLQTLVLFLFVVAVFLLLGWRTEVNQREIQLAQWNSCTNGVRIITIFNRQQQDLADIERTQKLDPTLAQRRIEIYERTQFQPLPSCGEKPSTSVIFALFH
jgi:hypothetical protein